MANVLELIKREMQLNNFKLECPTCISKKVILGELSYCLHPNVHEKQVEPYGAVFCGRSSPRSLAVRLVTVADSEIEMSRQFADGRRSFLVYLATSNPKLGIYDIALGDEYRLLQLAEEMQGIVLQRLHTGVVKLIQNGEIYSIRGRMWSHKESIDKALNRILAYLENVPIAEILSILRGFITLCYYYLSPEGVGATLVWLLNDKGVAAIQSGRAVGLASLDLSVRDADTYPLIRHILEHQDGATSVLSSGKLECTGVHLTFSEKAAKAVLETHGTRHTSAARFTYDHPEAIAFVVSQDGPVTIFSDGANIAELPIGAAAEEATRLEKVAPAKKSDISHASFVKKCKSCGRSIRIEQVTVIGWKDPEQVNCPVCGQELYSAMCFNLEAYPIKKL